MSGRARERVVRRGDLTRSGDSGRGAERLEARDGESTRRARIAAAIQSSAAVIVLIVVTLLGAIAFGPKFASVNNLLNIVEDSSFLALLAIGMTFVIMGGGNDLSVGSSWHSAGSWLPGPARVANPVSP